MPKSQKWSKPLQGQVKLNVDTAFHVDSCSGATGGVIIRDDRGFSVTAAVCFLPHCLDAGAEEAIALRNRLILADRTGCNRVLAESDCLEVVETLNEASSR